MEWGQCQTKLLQLIFLLNAKTGIKNIALAITECQTPEVRGALKQYFNDAVATHETIFNYMVKKGYYHPNNMAEQLNVDLTAAQTALNIPQVQNQSQTQDQQYQ